MAGFDIWHNVLCLVPQRRQTPKPPPRAASNTAHADALLPFCLPTQTRLRQHGQALTEPQQGPAPGLHPAALHCRSALCPCNTAPASQEHRPAPGRRLHSELGCEGEMLLRAVLSRAAVPNQQCASVNQVALAAFVPAAAAQHLSSAVTTRSAPTVLLS